MHYLDFDLEISPGSGQDYPVAVLRSPAGECHATMRFPFDEAALNTYHETIQTAMSGSGQARRQASQTVQDFGQQLFESLFTGDIRSCYDVSQREAARQDDRGLRVKLRVQAPDLAALPWEFLYDARQGEYLCLSRQTPLVRYLELPQSAQPLQIKPPLRILGMVASPNNQEQLDIPRERGRIEEALGDLQARGLVELTWLEGQTWRDLQRAMRAGPWHIFHFIGHGGFDPRSDEGVLLLADEQGGASLLTATQMGHLLADHRSLRLALLNACQGAQSSERDLFSSTAATLARRGIPAVLAMQYEITDRAAIECTRAFYEALADALPVDAAVSEARKAITLSIANTLEWATPVLYMRSPDGALFEIAKEKRHSTATSAPRKTKTDAAPAKAAAPASKIGELLCTYRGHDDWVMRVAWSPDGTRITSSQKFDRFVHLWETEFGAQLLTYEGHRDAVWDAPWSSDGALIASCSEDGTVQVWKAESGELLRTYTKHQGKLYVAAWASDGKRVASGDQKGALHIWLASSGALIKSWSAHANNIGALAWSPDGKRLVTGGGDSLARVWDAATGDLLFEFDHHQDSVYAVAWAPDGNHIASCSGDGTIQVWAPDGHGSVLSTGDQDRLTLGLAWSLDSTRLALASDEQILLLDARTLETIFTYTSHSDTVRAVAWSPDGTRIASASNDATVHIWRAL